MDETLMRQLAAGDMQAFSALIGRHQEDVLRIAYHFMGNVQDAEDVAQEVFLRLYRYASSYDSRGRFRAFLSRIATNECLNRLRREKKFSSVPLNECEIAYPGENTEREELATELKCALDQLPARQRLAFLLKTYSNLSYREIGHTLSCSRIAVEGLVFRARHTLQRKLQHLARM